jgi:hypothetical protein
VRLGEGQTLVGRGADCDVVLPHPTVSRQHARLEVHQGRCFLRDVGSRLGTYRNGELVARAELAQGDVLRLGHLRVDVHAAGVAGVALSDGHAHVSEASVAMPQAAGRLSGVHAVRRTTLEGEPPPAAPPDVPVLLAALADIGGALVRSASAAEILERVVALIFDLTRAERVFVMLADEGAADLVPRVARCRDGTTPHGATISRTIARLVMTDRVALLASDTAYDARLDQAESIATHRIR